MKRFVLMAAITIGLTWLATARAEAAIFEPQHDWWNSGRTCVDSRNPPGLAWDDSAPRACVAGAGRGLRKPRADALDGALAKESEYSLVSAERALAGKPAVKI